MKRSPNPAEFHTSHPAMNRSRAFILSVLLLVLASTLQLHAAEPSAQLPNFLVILTDDQSWVGTSLLMDPANPDTKSDYLQTPNIDKLASSGMRFTYGYASGAWCTPTRRSIQCGKGPQQHIYNNAKDGNESQFANGMSIPRALKQVNPAYACAHFGKWHLQYASVTPETLGYDVSDGDTNNEDGDLAGQPDAAVTKSKTSKNTPDVWEDPKTIFSLTKRTGDFIDAQSKAGNPWFVQLSHYAVHLKIGYRQGTLDALQSRPLGKKHAVPEFAAMTEDLDTGIGELMARLKSMGVLSNTYIIFLSDNGGRGKIPVEGKADRSTLPTNYPLAESKHSIYEGGLRVPFAIIGPGIASGAVSAVPVSGVDILPTIADFAGHDAGLGEGLDGGSFKDVALGKAVAVKRAHEFLVTESEGRERLRNTENAKPSDFKAALHRGDYKLIKLYGGAGDGQKELYNLAEDIGEDHNLIDSMGARAAELENALDDYLYSVGGMTKSEGGRSRRKISKE
tara:strand:+ start:11153 stop:12676 length:1524 start_codon:yes stop_codon:yes gene_type:complete